MNVDAVKPTTMRVAKRCVSCSKVIQPGEHVLMRTFTKTYRSWKQDLDPRGSTKLRFVFAHVACAVEWPLMLGRESLTERGDA